jgi:hypothetical protein
MTSGGSEVVHRAGVNAIGYITEREALLTSLEDQRQHVLSDLDGLDEGRLRRAVLPSRWNCLGLLGHLTIDVERFWFRGVVAGEQYTIEKMVSDADSWEAAVLRTPNDVFAAYRDEVVRSNAIFAASSLDAGPAWWPEGLFGSWKLETVREIVLHVIAETAAHAGQLDAVRELIDGKQWVVQT